MPTEPQIGKHTTTFQITLPVDMHQFLKQRASDLDRSAADLVRQAIENEFPEYEVWQSTEA